MKLAEDHRMKMPGVRQRRSLNTIIKALDREIARESGASAPELNPGAVGAAGMPPVAPAVRTPTAEEILAQYAPPTANTTRDVKRGCYLYFVFALGMLVICASSVYVIYTRLLR